MKIRRPDVFITKASRLSAAVSMPAATDQSFEPRIRETLPSDGAFTTGTGAAKTRARKFVAAHAANCTVFGASAATTTSASSAVSVTAFAAIAVKPHAAQKDILFIRVLR